MSNQVNISLYERASDMLDFFEGKLPAELIEADIDSGDLESLNLHVCQAEAEASRQEFNNNDIY